MSDSDALWVCAIFGMVMYILSRHAQRIADLEEDIDLLIEGETGKELAVAKRKLAGRQVARETGKDKL